MSRLLVIAILFAPALALAERPVPVVRVAPASETETMASHHVSNIIFLNRCTGGCTITKTTGISDARTNQSTIPMGTGGQVFTVGEFAHSEAEWQELVSCVRDVYAPYNIMVTDVDPVTAVHHEAVVAGVAEDIGWMNNMALGVGTVAADCSPYDNGISFAFANLHADMEDLCWTVAQETGHTYGLDHVLDTTASGAGLSACTDPMTYSFFWCGRKFFRNKDYPCGESSQRPCRCGGSQNSHNQLTSVFGLGPPIPTPEVTIVMPTDGSTILGSSQIYANALAERGVSRLEVYFNGWKWIEKEGNRPDSQDAIYQMALPGGLPDGVIDIEVRAINDLQTGQGSQTVTVTKGAPCASADSCLPGQKCEEGRCFWDPATGELGADCEYPQFCLSGVCEAGVCTQECFVGVAGDCPEDMECVSATGGGDGFCVPGDGGGGGGCCSTGDTSSGALLAQLGIAGLVLGGVFRRRRRRR